MLNDVSELTSDRIIITSMFGEYNNNITIMKITNSILINNKIKFFF